MPYKDPAKKRAWRQQHPNYLKEWHKLHPGKYSEYARQRDPVKVTARKAVHKAVSQGILEKQTACERCKDMHRVQAHHDDYTKQLEVRWLCEACHNYEHV